ncbi:MAG: hypothetical protein R3F60_28325 [bacterium]
MLRSLGVTCTLALTLFGCPPDDGESLNGGVNNVDCPPGSECNWTCNGGVCNIDCLADSVCDVTCNGGICNLDCAPGATCDFRCNGGVCNFDCQDGSDCSTGRGVRPRSDAGISVDPDAGGAGRARRGWRRWRRPRMALVALVAPAVKVAPGATQAPPPAATSAPASRQALTCSQGGSTAWVTPSRPPGAADPALPRRLRRLPPALQIPMPTAPPPADACR